MISSLWTQWCYWYVALQKRLGITGKHREVGSLMHRTQSSDKLPLCDYLLAQSRAGVYTCCLLTTAVVVVDVVILSMYQCRVKNYSTGCDHNVSLSSPLLLSCTLSHRGQYPHWPSSLRQIYSLCTQRDHLSAVSSVCYNYLIRYSEIIGV